MAHLKVANGPCRNTEWPVKTNAVPVEPRTWGEKDTVTLERKVKEIVYR